MSISNFNFSHKHTCLVLKITLYVYGQFLFVENVIIFFQSRSCSCNHARETWRHIFYVCKLWQGDIRVNVKKYIAAYVIQSARSENTMNTEGTRRRQKLTRSRYEWRGTETIFSYSNYYSDHYDKLQFISDRRASKNSASDNTVKNGVLKFETRHIT